MDESVIRHLEQPQVGTLKLSEAIRKGKPLVGKEGVTFRLCALGCAWAGAKGRLLEPDDVSAVIASHDRHGDLHFGTAILRLLGYPTHLGEAISMRHSGGDPALQIADWLERQGY